MGEALVVWWLGVTVVICEFILVREVRFNLAYGSLRYANEFVAFFSSWVLLRCEVSFLDLIYQFLDCWDTTPEPKRCSWSLLRVSMNFLIIHIPLSDILWSDPFRSCCLGRAVWF